VQPDDEVGVRQTRGRIVEEGVQQCREAIERRAGDDSVTLSGKLHSEHVRDHQVDGLFQADGPESAGQPLGPDRIALDSDDASPTPGERDRQVTATRAELHNQFARAGPRG